MPDELAEMRDRQDRFDARLTTLEERVKAEAILRAAMDRDISDVKTEQRAQRGLLQAIATTQSDHTRQFSEHGTRLTAIEGRLGNVEGRLGNVEGRLGNVETELAEVKGTLGNVQIGVQTIIAMLDRSIGHEEGQPG